mmetsp:Transcript_14026/g.24105  ORF Transcript_14026/g.24105 Transcript_14026/m.24105 type:complete len:211 (+) Transcript_14026:91-723(+)
MLQWLLVFGVCVVEGLSILLLVLPLPHIIQRWWMRFLHVLWTWTPARRTMIGIFIITGFLFIDTMRLSYVARAKMADSDANPQTATLLFRHQRNAYLSGITLFLLLILYRFQVVLAELFALEKKVEAVHKNEAHSGQDVTNKIVLENKELQLEVEDLKKQLSEQGAELKKVSALEKQYENQADEYFRLLQENKELLDEKTRKTIEEKKAD